MAFIALRNYLKETDKAMHCPTGFMDYETTRREVVPGPWRKEVQSSSTSSSSNQVANLPMLRGRQNEGSALQMRDSLKDHVNSEVGHCRGNWTMFVALNN